MARVSTYLNFERNTEEAGASLAAARDLSSMAEEMTSVVGRFNVERRGIS